MNKFYDNLYNCIVLDGNQCSGKTTLAKVIAFELKAVYVNPFTTSIGELIHWLFLKKRFAEINRIAQNAIQKEIDKINADYSYVVFDTHWLSMLSILPAEFWSFWNPVPNSFLCICDAANTKLRFINKNNESFDENLFNYYNKVYLDIAAQYGVTTINTSDNNLFECQKKISEYIKNKAHVGFQGRDFVKV